MACRATAPAAVLRAIVRHLRDERRDREIGIHYVSNGEARVIQHCLIGINNSAVRVQDRDRLRNTIDYLLKVERRL